MKQTNKKILNKDYSSKAPTSQETKSQQMEHQ